MIFNLKCETNKQKNDEEKEVRGIESNNKMCSSAEWLQRDERKRKWRMAY